MLKATRIKFKLRFAVIYLLQNRIKKKCSCGILPSSALNGTCSKVNNYGKLHVTDTINVIGIANIYALIIYCIITTFSFFFFGYPLTAYDL